MAGVVIWIKTDFGGLPFWVVFDELMANLYLAKIKNFLILLLIP